MDEKRIIELLARKMADEANSNELEELDRLLLQYPDALYFEEVVKQLWLKPEEEINTDYIFLKHKLKYQADFNEEEEEKETPVKHISYRRILSYAAVLLVLVFSVYLFRDQFGAVKAESKITEIVAGKGVRKKIILPDGTQVWLNAESKLSFDDEMNKKETRLVKLTGEAYFDVAHNKKRPFIIHTDKISIKVLGTAFNVKAYPGDKRSEATLLRGTIELSVNDRPQQRIILKPSEKFSLIENKTPPGTDSAQSTKDITLVIANIEPVKIYNKKYIMETAWTQDKLVFQDETFEDLAPQLERWFNVTIQINSKEIKACHFSGVFTHESIEKALSAMKLIKPFNYKLTNNEVTIY